MKTFRVILMIGAAAASLACPRTVLADNTTPPTVVPQDKADGNMLRDLTGVPANVKTLIVSFDKTRDQYLEQQRKLLVELHQATTAQMREAIRDQMQTLRQQYLTDLKTFRQQLTDDLQALKGKISHPEFNRIIDAAHDAAGGTVAHPRKGN